MAPRIVAFASGVVFALGLGISGMTRPEKVIAFLDVTGAWDPSLAFVMVGAIAVHFGLSYRFRAGKKPVFAENYALPESRTIDARLVVGALLFGLGWGAAGFCPGPALVSIVTLAPSTLAFVVAMLGGMLVHDLWLGRRTKRAPDSAHL